MTKACPSTGSTSLLLVCIILLGPVRVWSGPVFPGAVDKVLSIIKSRPHQDPKTAKSNGDRLIMLKEDEPAFWVSMDEILTIVIKNGLNFMDITEDNKYPRVTPTTKAATGVPKNISQQSLVKPLFSHINNSRMLDFLNKFSAFYNRYYRSATGRESQKWLLSQVEESIKGYNGTAKVGEVNHQGWLQKSIIVHIEGSNANLKDELVIMGGHLDSINNADVSGRAPGADDNGSGSAVVLETLRILMKTGFIPQRSLEFHFYAAEEVGLLGSTAIANSYRDKGAKVISALNIDGVGYQTKNISNIALGTDYTSPELTQFLRLTADAYLDYGRFDMACGYTCSDHVEWYSNGYPAAYLTELEFEFYHTVKDTVDTVKMEQVQEAVKLALGYAVEISMSVVSAAQPITSPGAHAAWYAKFMGTVVVLLASQRIVL